MRPLSVKTLVRVAVHRSGRSAPSRAGLGYDFELTGASRRARCAMCFGRATDATADNNFLELMEYRIARAVSGAASKHNAPRPAPKSGSVAGAGVTTRSALPVRVSSFVVLMV